jgi:PAS domain S-box-containing protein
VLFRSPSGRLTYANPAAQAWAEAHGLPEEGLYRLLPNDFRELLAQALEKNATLETTCRYEDHVFNLKLNPFRGLDACLATLVDVTAFERLNAEREIYLQAFERSNSPVAITDTEGDILHVNKAFEALYGYSEEEVIGENPRVLNPGLAHYLDNGFTEEEYRSLFRDLWESITDPRIGVWEGDVINRKKDGQTLWCRLFVSAIRNDEGKPIAYAAMPIDIDEQRRYERSIRLECYRAISELAEARDNETGEHLQRMSAYARCLARQLGLPKKFCEDMEIFAPLHDIGKVGISDSILLAPRKLTDEEFAVMKTHTTIGYNILKDRPTLEMAAEIAHSHQEKFDGSGYPQGLAGEAIPLSARILAVADVYDALRSRRPYKEPWPHEKALAELQNGRGRHFDPEVVEAFLAVETEMRRIADSMPDAV